MKTPKADLKTQTDHLKIVDRKVLININQQIIIIINNNPIVYATPIELVRTRKISEIVNVVHIDMLRVDELNPN